MRRQAFWPLLSGTMQDHQGGMSSDGDGDTNPPQRTCVYLWRKIAQFCRGFGPIEVFTAVLAVSAFLQVVYFVTSERAFLAVMRVDLKNNLIAADSTLLFTIRIINSGKSTAFITAANTTVTFTDTKLPDIPEYKPGPAVAKGPIVPGAIKTGTFVPQLNGVPYVVPSDLAIKINASDRKMYIFGYLSYSEEYSLIAHKKTGFCYVFDPKGDVSAGMFNDCDTDNYVYSEYKY